MAKSPIQSPRAADELPAQVMVMFAPGVVEEGEATRLRPGTFVEVAVGTGVAVARGVLEGVAVGPLAIVKVLEVVRRVQPLLANKRAS